MKKAFLLITIVFIGMAMQAQQKSSDVGYINLQTYAGEPDSLYKGHNYDYYNATFKKATRLRNAGIVFTSLSVGLYAAAFVYSGINLNTTAVFFSASVISMGIGVPLWITGSVKRKKNRKAMEQIKKTTSLSLRTTNNGAGLVLNF